MSEHFGILCTNLASALSLCQWFVTCSMINTWLCICVHRVSVWSTCVATSCLQSMVLKRCLPMRRRHSRQRQRHHRLQLLTIEQRRQRQSLSSSVFLKSLYTTRVHVCWCCWCCCWMACTSTFLAAHLGVHSAIRRHRPLWRLMSA